MRTGWVVPTTGIDDVGCHVLWGDFWGDCDLRHDVLDLEWVSRRAEGRDEEDVHVRRRPP